MVYKGLNGDTYEINEQPLGKGGEGSVYQVAGNTSYVIKIYNAQFKAIRFEKVSAMIRVPLSKHALESISWPIDIVFDENNQFVGYVMKMIKPGKSIYEVASDTNYSLLKKIIIAKNLCAVVNSFHEANLVCGDFNPKNIIIDTKSGYINLIDMDSFCFVDKKTGKEYRCSVALPEYLAPEIHEALAQNPDKCLSTLLIDPFSKETDLFALAIHIFTLLMNNCHPFGCAFDNQTDEVNQISLQAPQPIDNIKTHYFPFYIKRDKYSIPLYAPPFEFLPINLRGLFIRAFTKTPNERPSAEEWYNELDKALFCVKECHNNHYYFSHADYCIYCNQQNEHFSDVSLFAPKIEWLPEKNRIIPENW